MFNSYGSRRGNDRVMTRGTFANVRVRNQLAPGTEGGYTTNFTTGEVTFIHDAAQSYKAAGTAARCARRKRLRHGQQPRLGPPKAPIYWASAR